MAEGLLLIKVADKICTIKNRKRNLLCKPYSGKYRPAALLLILSYSR